MRAERAGVIEFTFSDFDEPERAEKDEDRALADRVTESDQSPLGVSFASYSPVVGWCNSPTEREALGSILHDERRRRLSEGDFELLELAATGHTDQEMAVEYEITPGAARGRLHRARKRAAFVLHDLLVPELDVRNPVGGRRASSEKRPKRKSTEPKVNTPRLSCVRCGAWIDAFPTGGRVKKMGDRYWGSRWLQEHTCNVVDISTARKKRRNTSDDFVSYLGKAERALFLASPLERTYLNEEAR